MALEVKKKVSLAFLGEDYSDSYIIVKSIPIGEYEKLKGTVKDNVIKYFVSGEIKQDSGMVEITKDNLLELPGEVFVEAFEQMTGTPDPKSKGQ